MIAIDGGYAPCVLRGRSRTHTKMAEPVVYGYYRMLYVLDGVHDVKLGDVHANIGPDTAYLILPGVNPDVTISEGARSLMIAFIVMGTPLRISGGQTQVPRNKKHMQPLPMDIWGIDLPVILDQKLSPMLLAYIQIIASCWWRSAALKFRANMQLVHMLEQIVNHYGFSEMDTSADQHDENWVIKIEWMMQKNLATIQTVQQLAQIVGLSERHLSQRFKQVIGQTPAAYLRHLRLLEAVRLVQDTDWSITRIAEHVGYRSASVLNRSWAAHYPVPPLTWRQQRRVGSP